ncbi:MAG: DNA primase DnaG [Candidatus Pacearchaeota archaeon]
MAKISPVSIKYVIYAKFQAEGVVEKPDVIGAIFGQTEGLLGEELELRELQKEGKIGRVEVSIESTNGKTSGQIEIPTALDKTETTLIGAAIETIERIGPSDAKITVERIEDVRGSKRDYILERAKKLLSEMEEKAPVSREMEEKLKEEMKLTKLTEYGPEKLSAGDISGKEIIVVEGRADVINLLKNGIKNVISMNGTKLPETIKELSKEKDLVLFVDGDRGGKLIAKNAVENTRIAGIVSAPDGKEVEELSKKEILAALRKIYKPEEFFKRAKFEGGEKEEIRKKSTENLGEERNEEYTGNIDEKIRSIGEEIYGSKMAVLLDKEMRVIKKVNATSVLYAIKSSKKPIHSIVIDGTATATIIKVAEEYGIKNIAARNFGAVREGKVKLVSL